MITCNQVKSVTNKTINMVDRAAKDIMNSQYESSNSYSI